MSPEDWFTDDPFADPEDPQAAERARRRREREEQRRQRDLEPEGPRADVPPPAESLRAAPGASQAEPEPALQPATPPPPKRVPRQRRAGPLAALVCGLLALGFLWVLFQPFHGDGSGRVVVEIPRGASVSEVADLLDSEGVVSSSALFQLRVTLAGKRSELYPGTYTLASGMSYGDALDAISTPPVKRTITITIPEGLSRDQVAPLLEDAGVSGDYLAETIRSPLLSPADYGGDGARNLEGFLFPATYELPAQGTAKQLVERQLTAFKERIRGIDLSYAKSKNLDVFDVLTIASMIEREVQVPRERRLVAAVIYNRLRDGIPLGIDATIRFAVGNYTEPLQPSELEIDSRYNTRLYANLPPGPIGSPGEAAIEAAANPARVSYRYYVVTPYTCGEHSFSTGYAEFQRNADEYQRALEAEGGAPTRC
jgi:uncharacterized YceG family protein